MKDATARDPILGRLRRIDDMAGELDSTIQALGYLSDRLSMEPIKAENPDFRGLRASICCIISALSRQKVELDREIDTAMTQARAHP